MVAGIAAYQTDEVKKSLDYFKEAQDFEQDPQVAAWIAKLQNELKNDKSGEKKFGTRFLLRYDGAVADPEAASAMLTILEQEFSKPCKAPHDVPKLLETVRSLRKVVGAAGRGAVP